MDTERNDEDGNPRPDTGAESFEDEDRAAGRDAAPVPGGEGAAPGEADPDRYLRLLAEFDNYRRRSAREREAAFEAGVAELARPLLTVLDNLERALSHAEQVPPAWLEGVTLTARQFQDALKAVGVAPVEPAGAAFDPRFHEALATVPTDAVPSGHVLEVVTRGYRIGDRVLRPAQVVVAHEPDGDS